MKARAAKPRAKSKAPAKSKPRTRNPERLHDCQPGDVVRLEFGRARVVVYDLRGGLVHCRERFDDDSVGEPVMVPGHWRVAECEALKGAGNG
jgi:hypothetical protein